jgi:hypothetical protein
VAEAHDLALARQGVVEPRHDPVGGSDLVEDVQHGLVRAAVQRPLSARSRRRPRSTGRRVEVITRAVKVEALKECSAYRIIEPLNASTAASEGSAERHPEEVRRVVEIGARIDRREPRRRRCTAATIVGICASR